MVYTGGKIAVYTGLLKITKNINALSVPWDMKYSRCCQHSIERMSSYDNKLRYYCSWYFLGGAINRTRNTVGQNTGLDIFQLGIRILWQKTRNWSWLFGFNFFILIWFWHQRVCKLWERMSENKKGKKFQFF